MLFANKRSPEQVEEGHHRQAQKEPEERTGRQYARHVEISEVSLCHAASPDFLEECFLLMLSQGAPSTFHLLLL